MNNKRVQYILQALIGGVDPITGEPLPPDSVVNKPEVLRALLRAQAALTAMTERETRRKMLPDNVGRTWSEEEEATLPRKGTLPTSCTSTRTRETS